MLYFRDRLFHIVGERENWGGGGGVGGIAQSNQAKKRHNKKLKRKCMGKREKLNCFCER